MDNADNLKEELEKLLSGVRKQQRPKANYMSNVLTWLLLVVMACGASLIVGVAIGFAAIGYKFITTIL